MLKYIGLYMLQGYFAVEPGTGHCFLYVSDKPILIVIFSFSLQY
jgi:hypothetical protein